MEQIKNILIVSQVIPQWYIDILNQAVEDNHKFVCITGSDVKGVDIEKAPFYNSISYKTKLISWVRFYRFVNEWIEEDTSHHFDLIFVVSNPPLNPKLGIKAKEKYNAPFIYMSWDLYPQSIGAISQNNIIIKAICKIWYQMNDRIYPQIDRVLTIGDIMAESVCNSLHNPINISVIPIAANTKKIQPIDKNNNKFLCKYGLSDKFVVLFSGKMGYGRQVDTVLGAAKILQDNENICFVLIGDGTYYSIAEKFISDNNLKNTKLFHLQPDDIYYHSIACGDVAIVAQNLKQARFSIPSRVYSMMSGGDAVIGLCSKHDDLQKLITDNNLGVCIYEHTPENLARVIINLYSEPNALLEMQMNARKTAETQYDYEVVTENYKELFKSVMK